MKRWILFLLIAACLLLSACSLLPAEETFRTAPVIRDYERETFTFAYVERGDMLLSQQLICTYVPVQTQTLSFSVGGLYYDEIYVSEGDYVQKGQLLAQLDLNGVEEQIENCALQIKKLNLRIAGLEENRTLALERQKIVMQDHTEQERNAALQKINDEYDRQRRSIQDELDIARLQMEEYETLVANRQLRAGIDGTVTYVRSIKDGQQSVAEERVIAIVDATNSIFRVETKLWNHFTAGDTYVITVSGEEFKAQVVSEDEIGLQEAEKTEGKAAYVYLQLKTPAMQLEDGDRGTLMLELDSRKDVLMIPEKAVVAAKGKTIVYYQDEHGMKAYKTVEIGLVADGMVEIISGLTEGESIIME